MNIQRIEDIIAWQKSKTLALFIYKNFSTIPDYGFRDQILRASVSVMNNIAEGFERNSDRELRQFLYIAKGSCGELRSMLVLASELSYIKQETYDELNELCLETSKLLAGFVKKL